MKKIFGSSFILPRSSFFLGSFDASDEDGGEFVCFLQQVGQFFLGDQAAFDKEFQPIRRSVEFLEPALKFADELTSRSMVNGYLPGNALPRKCRS